jgi:hypothetical protein
MASFQKTFNTDILSVRTIFARGPNNGLLPAFRVLATDGQGGTSWMTISTLTTGGAFHKIVTTTGTYTADASGATFTILDTPTAGLLPNPTASNSVFIYAKAFSQIDVSGSNTIYSFDARTQEVRSNVNIVGAGGIQVFSDPQTNTLTFDGALIPYLSTPFNPYSFSEFQVYSNVPVGTLVPSTTSSIIMEASDPSSLIKFVGVDPMNIRTDYARNTIFFEIPSLASGILQTISTQQAFLLSTAIDFQTFVNLSTTVSTMSSTVVYQPEFQAGLSTLSSATFGRINTYSTSIGSIETLRAGISSISTSSALQVNSTATSFTSNINFILGQINTDYNVLGKSSEVVPTPNVGIAPTQLTFLPSYLTSYNKFDEVPGAFGNPDTSVGFSTFNTTVDFSKDFTYSNFSSFGSYFSTNVVLRGQFQFAYSGWTSQEVITFDYSGALALDQGVGSGNNQTTVLQPLTAYPKPDRFGNNPATFDVNTAQIYTVNYTFLKRSPADYLRVYGTNPVSKGFVFNHVRSQLIPTHEVYGYTPTDTPLYQTTSNIAFPIGFSTMLGSEYAPYEGLSSYMLLLSTTYTTGMQTAFPLTTTGSLSFSAVENETQRRGDFFKTPLSIAPTVNFTSTFTASNLFGYVYQNWNTTSTYTLQLYYGHTSNSENLTLGQPTTDTIAYDFAPTVYVSSFIYASSISSYSGYFNNLWVSNINGSPPLLLVDLQLAVSSVSTNIGTVLGADNLSSMSTSYGIILGANNLSSMSSSYGIILAAENLSSMSTSYGTVLNSGDLSSFSTSYGSVASANSAVTGTVVSTMSTTYGDLKESSTLSTFIKNMYLYASTLNLSTFSTPWLGIIGSNISSFSTALGPGGGGSGTVASASTYSSFITNILNVASTVNGGNVNFTSPWSTVLSQSLSSFSTAIGPGGGGTSVASASTYSSFITNILNVASTVNTGLSTFTSPWSTVLSQYFSSYSTSVGPGGSGGTSVASASTYSSFITNILNVASTVNTGLSTFTSPWSTVLSQYFSSYSTSVGPGGSGGTSVASASTYSSFITNINNVASTVNTGLSTFTSPWSTVLGQSFSSFSTSYGAIATKQEVHTSTVFTSSVVLSGLRQPFIQYGSATLSGSGTATVNGGSGLLPYRDALYAVQLTYSNATAPTTLLTVTGRASNSFDVAGSNSAAFFWTTFGNLF